MKKINQKEIAKSLNLSRATVSRCFTNHPGINPETRARVFELASRLGYNHMVMRGSQTNGKAKRQKIGVLISSREEEYYRKDYESPGQLLIKGISEYCQLTKLNLSINFIEPTATSIEEGQCADLFSTIGRHWSGLLLLYPFKRQIIDQLFLKYPCVSLVEQRGASPLDCVDVNHYQGIALIINRLRDLGHRRIGFYSKSYEIEASWSLKRFGAYIEKMTQLDLPVRDKDMINVQPRKMISLEDSFDLAAERVKAGVTAFLCAADHQAYDLIRELRKRGIRVPEDVSITGFDGIPTPASMPKLSTVQIPYRDIGYVASKRLRDKINKRFGPNQHILLGCKFEEGQTIGPVR